MNARVASLCVLATAASAVLPPPPASCSGSVNTLPLWTGEPTLVSTVPGGAKYQVASNATAVPVILVHLYGDDAAMGRAYGALLKDELRVLLPEVLAYMYSQMNSSLAWISEPWRDVVMVEGLEAALNLTWAVTEPFSPPHWRALLLGVADGSGLSFMEVARFSMIPELLRAQCSIMGAWGAATAGGSAAGGLVQLRSLDWDTAGPFQQFPLIATFHPDAGAAGGVGGAAHTTVAWPGIMGALTGFSSSGLAISEKVFDAYTGPNARLGYPWHFLLAGASTMPCRALAAAPSPPHPHRRTLTAAPLYSHALTATPPPHCAFTAAPPRLPLKTSSASTSTSTLRCRALRARIELAPSGSASAMEPRARRRSLRTRTRP